MFRVALILIAALSSMNAIAESKWRGLLPFVPETPLVLGMVIDTDKGTLQLESPLQGMYEHVPTRYTVTDQGVSFHDEDLGARFDGTFSDEGLVGTFEQAGTKLDVTLQALSEKQTDELQNEGVWAGDLELKGDNKLPLELVVAVGPDGFHALLNSPAQNSFGIPVSSIDIVGSNLTFESSVIGASYTGEIAGDQVSGEFTQGFAFPLTLKKND